LLVITHNFHPQCVGPFQ